MAARPEVVALLTDVHLHRTGSVQRLMHRQGTPFTAEETDLPGSATDDMRAAARELVRIQRISDAMKERSLRSP